MYINEDDIPELAVMNEYDAGELYTVVNSVLVKVHSWESMRLSGSMSYMPRQNSFVTYSSGSYNTYGYGMQKMNPDGSMELVRSGGCNDGVYFLDGNNTTQSEVDSYMNEINQNYTYVYDTYYDIGTLNSMLT